MNIRTLNKIQGIMRLSPMYEAVIGMSKAILAPVPKRRARPSL